MPSQWRSHVAKVGRNNNTAAQLTVRTLSGTWYLDPLAAAECGLEVRRDNWRLTCQRNAARIERYAQKTNRKRICLAELLDKGGGGDKQFRQDRSVCGLSSARIAQC